MKRRKVTYIIRKTKVIYIYIYIYIMLTSIAQAAGTFQINITLGKGRTKVVERLHMSHHIV